LVAVLTSFAAMPLDPFIEPHPLLHRNYLIEFNSDRVDHCGPLCAVLSAEFCQPLRAVIEYDPEGLSLLGIGWFYDAFHGLGKTLARSQFVQLVHAIAHGGAGRNRAEEPADGQCQNNYKDRF
jgi:hypothetical protein